MNIRQNTVTAAATRHRHSGTGQVTRGARRVSALRAMALEFLLAAFVAAGMMPLPLGLSSAHAQMLIKVNGPNRTATVNVAAGKSQDVRTEESFSDISVGDPEIADVNPLTDKTLSILGKKVGTTRVSVYGTDKKLVGIFDVEVGYETTRIARELRTRFPNATIKVSSINGKVMLSGTAPDAVTVDQVMTIAKQFVPDSINAMAVASPQQVVLEVRFVEVTRQAGRELGVQWNVFAKGGVVNIGSRQAPGNLPITAPTSPTNIPIGEVAAGVLSNTSPYGFALARMINGGTTTDILVNALEQKGAARTLAEPNLVALSGDTASFLAGGEFPVPVPGALGQVSIEYKRYGVGLAFTPTVLSHGLINLKIEPEVSQLDTSHPVTVAGISVPPLIVRRASTTLELRDGQSFVLGGLLQNFNSNDQQQLPWIGDVPVLGALFRSASFQKNETDLAIIVTPHVVRPARPGDVVKTPTDNSLPPNDADLFLMGKSEMPRNAGQIALGADLPMSGHILDLPKGGAHVVRVRN